MHHLFSVPRSLRVHRSAVVTNFHSFHLPLDLSAAPGLFLFLQICLFHDCVVFITVSFFNLSFELTLLICLITDVAIYSFFNPIGPCPHRDLGWKGWHFLTSSTPSPSSQLPTLAPTSQLSYCSFLSVTLRLNIKTREGTLCLFSTIR